MDGCGGWSGEGNGLVKEGVRRVVGERGWGSEEKEVVLPELGKN
jgi:hypothetical protein